ncbi:hypothetical protein [Bosea sp. (in: a-proteobacteria)]|uniref:hypothetical protein n=1 Tax=Bosea sp. (in: a-proteobacteria) TaxID=1871050 RepID=UPI004034C9FE
MGVHREPGLGVKPGLDHPKQQQREIDDEQDDPGLGGQRQERGQYCSRDLLLDQDPAEERGEPDDEHDLRGLPGYGALALGPGCGRDDDATGPAAA